MSKVYNPTTEEYISDLRKALEETRTERIICDAFKAGILYGITLSAVRRFLEGKEKKVDE